MEINHINRIKKSETIYIHSVDFTFEHESFLVTIQETEEETVILQCLKRDWRLVDIPTYFGEGFSLKVQNVLFSCVEPGFK